jgi:HEAT repeat protein
MHDKSSPHCVSPPTENAVAAKVQRLLSLKDGLSAVPQVVALGQAAVPHLEPLLRGPAESIFEPRCLVADTLGMIGGEHAAEVLLRALADSLGRKLDPAREYAELAVINRIAENLGRLKDPRAREPLLHTLMHHPYPGVIRALAQLEETRAIPWIVNALSDDFAREAAIEAIRAFGRRALPALLVYLEEGAAPVTQSGRACAARLLSEAGTNEVIEPLRRALADASATVRLGAAVALSAFPQRAQAADAVPVLLEFLADDDPHRAEESMNALMRLQRFSEPALIRLIREHARDGTQTRKLQRTLVLLERFATWPALEAIAALHAQPQAHLRFRALQVLRATQRPDTAPLIAQFLRDPHPLIMNLSMESLQHGTVGGAPQPLRAQPRAATPLYRRILAALKTRHFGTARCRLTWTLKRLRASLRSRNP